MGPNGEPPLRSLKDLGMDTEGQFISFGSGEPAKPTDPIAQKAKDLAANPQTPGLIQSYEQNIRMEQVAHATEQLLRDVKENRNNFLPHISYSIPLPEEVRNFYLPGYTHPRNWSEMFDSATQNLTLDSDITQFTSENTSITYRMRQVGRAAQLYQSGVLDKLRPKVIKADTAVKQYGDISKPLAGAIATEIATRLKKYVPDPNQASIQNLTARLDEFLGSSDQIKSRVLLLVASNKPATLTDILPPVIDPTDTHDPGRVAQETVIQIATKTYLIKKRGAEDTTEENPIATVISELAPTEADIPSPPLTAATESLQAVRASANPDTARFVTFARGFTYARALETAITNSEYMQLKKTCLAVQAARGNPEAQLQADSALRDYVENQTLWYDYQTINRQALEKTWTDYNQNIKIISTSNLISQRIPEQLHSFFLRQGNPSAGFQEIVNQTNRFFEIDDSHISQATRKAFQAFRDQTGRMMLGEETYAKMKPDLDKKLGLKEETKPQPLQVENQEQLVRSADQLVEDMRRFGAELAQLDPKQLTIDQLLAQINKLKAMYPQQLNQAQAIGEALKGATGGK